MPNLDNIHYKFFPKSKTAPYGKTLIKFAWGVEILVAIVGLSIAWMFYTGGISTGPIDSLVDEAQQRFKVEGVIVSLAFIVVSVIELTKIPLATAFYYAGKIRWKFVFFVALILINISTFETIIQGFELSYYQRSKDVDKVRQELNVIKNEITQKDKGSVEQKTNLKNDYDSLLEEKSKLLEQKTSINKQKNLDIESVKGQAAIANPRIATLEKQIQDVRESIGEYQIYSAKQIQEKQSYILQLENKTFKGSLSLSRRKQQEMNDKKIESVRNEISKLEGVIKSEIVRKESIISALQREKDKLEGEITRDITDKIIPIEQNTEIDLNNINSLIETKDKELEAVSKNIKAFDENTENYTRDLVLLKDACVKKADELEKVAAGNQTYRFAVRIKAFRMWTSDWSFSKLIGLKEMFLYLAKKPL